MKFSKPMSHRLVPVLSEYSENTPCCSREKSELFPTPTRPANTILYSGMLKNELDLVRGPGRINKARVARV